MLQLLVSVEVRNYFAEVKKVLQKLSNPVRSGLLITCFVDSVAIVIASTIAAAVEILNNEFDDRRKYFMNGEISNRK